MFSHRIFNIPDILKSWSFSPVKGRGPKRNSGPINVARLTHRAGAPILYFLTMRLRVSHYAPTLRSGYGLKRSAQGLASV